MTRTELLEFMRHRELAVQASASQSVPQAAVVGVVITDEFEVFFDTLESTRKARNLREDPRIAFVIGGTVPGDEQTVQYEGIVDEPSGAELTRLKQLYFARFPDGPTRERWKGITYFRAKPSWIRFSDYAQDPPVILEFTSVELSGLA
jgi:uncharacterized protein YhbP (UPF0306 family)